MNVFVTGATGFVGSEIVKQLGQAGHTIRILARTPDSPSVQKLVSQHKVSVYRGNILDPNSLSGGLSEIDAVIHLVGIISEIGRATFENIHVRGTENLVKATQAAGVPRFVQMSALGARPNAVSRYHQSKWAAEEIVRGSDLDYTIFRPSIIYGPGDQFVNLFARMSRWSPILPIMGSGEGTLQPLPVADVAQCFVRSLSEPQSVGHAYDLCGPDLLTMPEILSAICDVTNRKRLQIRIPLIVARLFASILETIFPLLLRKAPPLSRDQLIMIEEKTIGNRKPPRDLGISPPLFREGLGRYSGSQRDANVEPVTMFRVRLFSG